MIDEPTADLEQVAGYLRQTAWILGEFYSACRSAGLPDALAHDLVADYHREVCLAPTEEEAD